MIFFEAQMMGFPDSNEIINNRKNKVLSFVEKDLFIINNYESAPFKNKNHAIECLIPYHVFQVMADDIKFKGSDIDIELNREVDMLTARLEEMIEETAFNTDGFTPQLLLYHEQRYINSLMMQNKAVGGKKKRERAVKVSNCIRIPRSNLYIYGVPSSIHIRIRK